MVKLISYTQLNTECPLTDPQSNLQDIIAYTARVSNPGNQLNTQTTEKLIKYLLTHSHWSPFEMVSACVEINTTRDIARQIIRHRSFTFQEFSQRYADPTDALGFELRQARLQDFNNRQNSVPVNGTSKEHLETEWNQRQQDVLKVITEAYTWAMSNGIAKEQARAILPEGNTLSRLYMSGTIRSWIHYVSIRTGQETQKEHRDIAVQCADALAKVFPLIKQFVK